MEKQTPLFVVTFVGGGYNQEYGRTKREAFAKLRQRIGKWVNQINSCRKLTSKKAIAAYWKDMPLMD